MREPPAHLSSELLCTCLQDRYGLAVAELSFLPLGSDSSAWVYRVRTADASEYFLKVRAGAVNEAGLHVPRYLCDQGITGVVAPLPTSPGTLWTNVAGAALVLYPFLSGRAGMERGLSDQQWVAFGTILAQIHATTLTPNLLQTMRRESYVPEGADVVRRLDAHISTRTFDDPAARAFAACWQSRREEIRTLLDRAEGFGRRLARKGLACVVCHTDIHTNNVLLAADQQVWIVDWDETILAPRERDLMFVIGGGLRRKLVAPHQETLFFQGYGTTTVDALAIAYYRYARAVSDIGYVGEQVFFRPDLGPASKRTAVERFLLLFQPGSNVSQALGLDEQAARSAALRPWSRDSKRR
ncbi:MAG TPA: phosphotransferase [Actinomycetes bacterium]|nr:phosphotransferase [Actinomycetes bacterium]